MRLVIGISGASGAAYGARFVERAPGEKYLIVSEWGQRVLETETGQTVEALAEHVKAVFDDKDLSAPFASGSNPYDAYIIIPCSLSTTAKIAHGIADTLITRVAQVALKERRRLILCIRETPLSSIALENCLKLSRDGVMVMPIAPPFYMGAETAIDLVDRFVDKAIMASGGEVPGGWRAEELE